MTIQNDTVDRGKRSSDNFSFIETLDSMINNHEFRDGLQDYYVGKHNKYSFVWEALQTIGQEVGETIYENVLNYIDIASNVDLCKVRSLQSISKSIGTDFSVFYGLQSFPLEIRNMIDVLSINRKYIMQTNFLCEKLIQDMTKVYISVDQNICEEISSRFVAEDGEILSINIPGYITEDGYRNYLSGVYYDFIYDMVNLPYNTGLSIPIWWIEEKDIFENDIKEDDTISLFKDSHAIPKSFDEKSIVDNIENGTENLEDYDSYKKECLKLEIERRAKTLRTNDDNDSYREKYKSGYETKLHTRYSYDRKEKVREYINLVQTQYNGSNDIGNIKGVYDIDRNYFVIPNVIETEDFIDIEKARKSHVDMSAVRTYMIESVARKLTQITVYISKIRELLKIHVQKYYAKGTFNLLSYIINEYLLELSQSDVMQDVDIVKTNVKANLSAHSFGGVNIIEYFDSTEYFNISCETSDKAYNRKFVNQRFWEQEQDTNTNSGYCFTDSQISNFYFNELELNNKIDDLQKFLDTVFNYGATTSFSNSDTSYHNTEGKDEDTTGQIEGAFLTYSGNRYGYRPYENMKNRTHSSVQVHPYLKNFIEYTRDKYPIINAFYNDTVSELGEAEALRKISEYIGKYGETVNVAVNNQYDYSGYKTRYESTPHDGRYDVEGYDGIFFPPAIEDYMNDPQSFIDSVSSMTTFDSLGNQTPYGKYYQSLGYTPNGYMRIARQLSEYRDKIIEIAREKEQLSDVHDIFKYGMDGYDNMYILLKRYKDYDIPYSEKKSVPGQLWIRLKNNPIPFPAFIGENSAVDSSKNFNGNIQYLASISCVGRSVSDNSEIYEHVMKNDKTDMSYFYDMEFSQNKKVLMLAAYPVNDVTYVGPDGKYNEMISSDYYLDYQHSDILINELIQEYDTVDMIDKLYFKALKNGRYSKEDSYNSTDSISAEQIYGKSFIGFYMNGVEISPVFLEKTYDKSSGKYIIDESNIRVSMQIWANEDLENTYNSLKLKYRDEGEGIGYGITDGRVEFSNQDGILTFAFLTYPKTKGVKVQSYIGRHNGYGCADYISQTSGHNILENDTDEMDSFDMLDTFITTVDVQIINDEFVDSGVKTYNLNSDASYIPSYPGQQGYTDVSKTNYSNSPTKSFEMLGDSDNIDDVISMVNPNADNSKELSDYLEEYTHGMMWEDYDFSQDNSLKQFTYNQREESGPDKGVIIWSIDIGQYGYSDRELSSMSIIMYNKNSSGKNPYYVGRLIDISATYDRPFVSLKDDVSSYMEDSSEHEVTSRSNSRIKVTGTYDYFSGLTNGTESNHLPNVRDIQLYATKDKIVVTFCPEDYDKTYFIKYDTVSLILCDPVDLKIFKYQHFLDHRQAVNGGMIDGVYLSAIELSDYSYLSDVPGLGGHDNLDFKYGEQDVFDISSNSYYFPCFNSSYPYRAVDTYVRNSTNKSDWNIVETDGIFNQRNLFVLKIDKNEIFDDIGRIYVPTFFNDEECMIEYEDYTYNNKTRTFEKDESRYYYDVIDPRILSCIEMYDMWGSYGKQTIDIEPHEQTQNAIDRIYEQCGFYTAFLEQTSAMYTTDYTEFTVSASDFEGIDKFLKIYVNYKKENDGTITMFFNYYNYINTPFMKLSENNKVIIDTREGTYLKLKTGEDGLLNIELQFKEYDTDGDFQGFSNVRVATYRIFNISDDKPKFIIHKISGVDKDGLQTGQTNTTIMVDSKTVEISREQTESPIEFTVNIHVDSNKILESGKYSVLYPSNELECLNTEYEQTSGRVLIDKPKGVSLTFRTRSNVTQRKTYQFTVRNVKMIDTNGMESSIKIYPGQISLNFALYLRRESDDISALILTENYNQNKKINI